MDSRLKMLSVKETAAYLGVSVQTVYRMLRDGQLPASRVRGLWRIASEGLLKRFAA